MTGTTNEERDILVAEFLKRNATSFNKLVDLMVTMKDREPVLRVIWEKAKSAYLREDEMSMYVNPHDKLNHLFQSVDKYPELKNEIGRWFLDLADFASHNPEPIATINRHCPDLRQRVVLLKIDRCTWKNSTGALGHCWNSTVITDQIVERIFERTDLTAAELQDILERHRDLSIKARNLIGDKLLSGSWTKLEKNKLLLFNGRLGFLLFGLPKEYLTTIYACCPGMRERVEKSLLPKLSLSECVRLLADMTEAGEATQKRVVLCALGKKPEASCYLNDIGRLAEFDPTLIETILSRLRKESDAKKTRDTEYGKPNWVSAVSLLLTVNNERVVDWAWHELTTSGYLDFHQNAPDDIARLISNLGGFNHKLIHSQRREAIAKGLLEKEPLNCSAITEIAEAYPNLTELAWSKFLKSDFSVSNLEHVVGHADKLPIEIRKEAAWKLLALDESRECIEDLIKSFPEIKDEVLMKYPLKEEEKLTEEELLSRLKGSQV